MAVNELLLFTQLADCSWLDRGEQLTSSNSTEKIIFCASQIVTEIENFLLSRAEENFLSWESFSVCWWHFWVFHTSGKLFHSKCSCDSWLARVCQPLGQLHNVSSIFPSSVLSFSPPSRHAILTSADLYISNSNTETQIQNQALHVFVRQTIETGASERSEFIPFHDTQRKENESLLSRILQWFSCAIKLFIVPCLTLNFFFFIALLTRLTVNQLVLLSSRFSNFLLTWKQLFHLFLFSPTWSLNHFSIAKSTKTFCFAFDYLYEEFALKHKQNSSDSSGCRNQSEELICNQTEMKLKKSTAN